MTIIVRNNEQRVLLWKNPEVYPEKLTLKYDCTNNHLDKFSFDRAELVENVKGWVELKCDLNERTLLLYDVVPNDFGAIVANKKTLDVLLNYCEKEIQYIPAIIKFSNKNSTYENKDYFIINLLIKVNAIDKPTSYLSYYRNTNKISSIRKLSIKEKPMGDHLLAREEDYLPLILVSKELANKLTNINLKGVNFVEPRARYNTPFPDEYIARVFPDSPDAAKRFLVSQLNNSEDYEFLKTRIHKIPLDIFEGIIELTLSKSSFHEEQCAELREIMKKHLESINSNI